MNTINIHPRSIITTSSIAGVFGGYVLFPNVVAANYLGEVDTFFASFVTFLSGVVIPLVVTIALVIFVWGMYLYFIYGGAEEQSREKGKKMALYAIIGFVLMMIIWGLVNLFATGIATGLGGEQKTKQLQVVPQVPPRVSP